MFRRGFKTWAEQTALRARQKLQLAATDPLDPVKLADLLGVIVLQPKDLSSLPADVVQRLITDHEESWSAITVSDSDVHLVVINPSHSATRLNSSLAHELSHIILGHDPSMMFMSPAAGIALRTHNEEQEEEANWLAGCFLLPRDVLLIIRRRRLTDEQACIQYGVSQAMLRYRINVSGVDFQLKRKRRF